MVVVGCRLDRIGDRRRGPRIRLRGHRHRATTTPLQAALGGVGGSVIGGFFAQVHSQHGVDVQLGTAVTESRGTATSRQ